MARMSNIETDAAWLAEGSKAPFRMFYILATTSFVLFTPPEGLAYTSLSYVRNAWWAALFLNCGILLLTLLTRSCQGKGKRLDTVLLLAVLTFLPIAVFTFANNGSTLLLLKKAAFILGPWLFLSVFGDYGFKPLLKAMLIGSIIIVVANAVSIFVMYSHGSFRPQYGDTWLFGQRTYMRNFLLPCLLFCALNDRSSNKRFSVLTLAVLGLAGYSVVVGDAMTSLVVLLLIVASIVLSWRGLKKTPIFRLYLAGAVVLDILLVHVRKLELFRTLIEGYLNRNMTLSYRTQVWDIALERIGEDPLSGSGINDLESSGLVVGFGKQLSNAHNQFLDVWFKGGAIAFAFFVALIVRCVAPLLKRSHLWAAFIMGVFVGGFFIEAVVGEVWYPQFFLLLFLSAYIYRWGPLFEKGIR